MLRVSSVRSFLWVSSIALICFAFPLQVAFMSPYPSLLPYIFLVIIFIISVQFPSRGKINYLKRSLKSPATSLIFIYSITTIFHSVFQAIFGLIPIVELLSVLVIYSFPVLFYFYVLTARVSDLNSILISTAAVGGLVGIFSVHDAYQLKNGIVSEYALSAFDYFVQRKSGEIANVNLTTITPGYRSAGLLEMHAVSAAWISFGAFSLLSLIKKDSFFKRNFVIATFGLGLIYFNNFTAIIGYFLTLILVEFHVFGFLSLRLKKMVVESFTILIFSFVLILFFTYIFLYSEFIHFSKFFFAQLDLAMGRELENSQGVKTTYFSGMFNSLASLPTNMNNYPVGLFIGDGFSSSFGVIKKGGDYGLVETFYKFGIFLSLAFLTGFGVLIVRSLKFLVTNEVKESQYLYFSLSCIIFIIFNDIHYSIWCTKSILPVLFISLALQQRMVVSKNNKNPNVDY